MHYRFYIIIKIYGLKVISKNNLKNKFYQNNDF